MKLPCHWHIGTCQAKTSFAGDTGWTLDGVSGAGCGTWTEE